MPKRTFFNLPIEKRETIEQRALDEFAGYGYDRSNVNRIVASSGIAKGSFYQYFDNKKDLYFHLIDSLVERKRKAIAPALEAGDATFVESLRALFRLGIEFARADPRLVRLGADFAGKHPAFVAEFVEAYGPMGVDVYRALLERAERSGELREGLDIPLAAAFINAMASELTVGLIGRGMERAERDGAVEALLDFVGRAVLAGAEKRGA